MKKKTGDRVQPNPHMMDVARQPPKVPAQFAAAVIDAGKIIGRTIDIDVAVENLRRTFHHQGELAFRGLTNSDFLKMPTRSHDKREQDMVLYCCALMSDDRGQFTATDAGMTAVVNRIWPVLAPLLERAGNIARCLLAGGPGTKARELEMRQRGIHELDEEDFEFLMFVLKGDEL